PMRLPVYTILQLRRTCGVDTAPLAQAMLIRALPVNNSAPPTMTSTKPKQNTTPLTKREMPNGSAPAVPALTVVEKTAPRAIKAPAKTAKVKSGQNGKRHLLAPTSAARLAISCGSRASMWAGSGIISSLAAKDAHELGLDQAAEDVGPGNHTHEFSAS